MPTGIGNPYNGSQSPLEYYAINGNPIPGSGPHAGLGRTKLLDETRLLYRKAFKNQEISGDKTTEYGIAVVNALSEQKTPYRGKGTLNTVDTTNTYAGYTARLNYIGGDDYDRNGGSINDGAGYSIAGVGDGRNKGLMGNVINWGYAPKSANQGGDIYTSPDTSANIGQVKIP